MNAFLGGGGSERRKNKESKVASGATKPILSPLPQRSTTKQWVHNAKIADRVSLAPLALYRRAAGHRSRLEDCEKVEMKTGDDGGRGINVRCEIIFRGNWPRKRFLKNGRNEITNQNPQGSDHPERDERKVDRRDPSLLLSDNVAGRLCSLLLDETSRG